MTDVRNERTCAIPFASLNKSDRPRHSIVIEYDHIEIACAQHCLEVPRVIACAEPGGNGLASARTVGFGRPGTMLHSIRRSNASAGRSDEAADVASPTNVTEAP